MQAEVLLGTVFNTVWKQEEKKGEKKKSAPVLLGIKKARKLNGQPGQILNVVEKK